MSDLGIRVEKLSKEYRNGTLHGPSRTGRNARYTRFGDALGNLVKAPLRRLRSTRTGNTHMPTFWALKDVSFEVERGEVIGVSWRHGASDSTRLKHAASNN